MRAWRVHRYGRPSEALRLDDDLPVPEPEAGQVRIAVRSTVLNFNDIDGCHGRYRTVNPPLPYVAGMEVAGEVEAAGPGAEAWIGRRVMATPPGAFGGYAERAVAPLDMTFETPETLDDEGAAAFFFPFHLAWLGLHERGVLQAGETVLVHAAAGGIGSAALQLAREAGARVIATAGSAEKLAFCRELGADAAINYREGDFAERVLDETRGRGVDVVFDTVGGAVAQQGFRAIALGGRHLIIGFSGGIEAEDSDFALRPVIFGNFQLVGVLLAYSSAAPQVKRATGFNMMPRERGLEVHARVTQLFEAGRIRPVIGRRIAFEEIPAGLEALEERKTIGRTVAVLGSASG